MKGDPRTIDVFLYTFSVTTIEESVKWIYGCVSLSYVNIHAQVADMEFSSAKWIEQ